MKYHDARALTATQSTEVLEAMIDSAPLCHVVNRPIDSCQAKATFIHDNGEDTTTATHWERAADILAKAGNRLRGEGISF